jgi:hypothetical protein
MKNEKEEKITLESYLLNELTYCEQKNRKNRFESENDIEVSLSFYEELKDIVNIYKNIKEFESNGYYKKDDLSDQLVFSKEEILEYGSIIISFLDNKIKKGNNVLEKSQTLDRLYDKEHIILVIKQLELFKNEMNNLMNNSLEMVNSKETKKKEIKEMVLKIDKDMKNLRIK